MSTSYLLWAGAAYAASKLSKPKVSETKAEDFVPSTLASQGSFVPRFWGKRRIGCVFGSLSRYSRTFGNDFQQ